LLQKIFDGERGKESQVYVLVSPTYQRIATLLE